MSARPEEGDLAEARARPRRSPVLAAPAAGAPERS